MNRPRLLFRACRSRSSSLSSLGPQTPSPLSPHCISPGPYFVFPGGLGMSRARGLSCPRVSYQPAHKPSVSSGITDSWRVAEDASEHDEHRNVLTVVLFIITVLSVVSLLCHWFRSFSLGS